MKMSDKIRDYIVSNGLKFNFVADKSGIKRKKFYRLINGTSQMSVEEYEKVCRLGLSLHPRNFFEDKFLENEKNQSA
ncbi:helix-turn-helix domain-containing protein [Brevibacillus brevis]|uniref:helix-turn-helix domain-containing protein n=1 Tax=Brevibacillus brevis TaxID=1393 RepID=UPI0037C787D0